MTSSPRTHPTGARGDGTTTPDSRSTLVKLTTLAGVIWFNTLMLLTVLIMTVLILLASCVLSTERLGWMTRNCFICLTRIINLLTPHLKIRIDPSSAEWSRVGASGRPVMLLSNHNSLYDFSALLLITPWAVSARARMLVTSGMLKLPLMGRIVAAGEARAYAIQTHRPQSCTRTHDMT